MSTRPKIPVVVFDTSALILTFKDNVRVIEQVYELLSSPYIPVVTIGIINELEKVAKWGKTIKVRKAAKMAIEYISKYFSIANIELEADESIIEFCRKYNAIVVTCDLELRKKLNSIGIRTIYFRESKHMMEIDY